MVHARAMTEIAARLAAVSDIHFAPAVAAAQKARQEQFAAPHRSSDQRTFAGRIVGNHALVPLELAPGNVALVSIREQYIPFRLWTPQPALDALAAILDAHLAHRPTESVRPSID